MDSIFFDKFHWWDLIFFKVSETAGYDYYYFSKPSSGVLEPTYLFWLTLNTCHLSNASLSLADTFDCTHFCHWIRNIKKSNNSFYISTLFSCLTFERFSDWVKGRPSKGTRNSVNMQKWPGVASCCSKRATKTCFFSQHCWKTNGITMLRGLPPWNQTCLATNQFAKRCCW